MIPWFVVNILAALMRPLGRQVMAVSTVGKRGADRIVIIRAGDFADASLLVGIGPAE